MRKIAVGNLGAEEKAQLERVYLNRAANRAQADALFGETAAKARRDNGKYLRAILLQAQAAQTGPTPAHEVQKAASVAPNVEAFFEKISAATEAQRRFPELAKVASGLTPPEAVRAAARRGLEARQKAPESQKGGLTAAEAHAEGIGSGVVRAQTLASGKSVSPETVKRMHAFFSRHRKNKDTPKGRIAWDLWGGDAGAAWAAQQVEKKAEAEKVAVGSPLKVPGVALKKAPGALPFRSGLSGGSA